MRIWFFSLLHSNAKQQYNLKTYRLQAWEKLWILYFLLTLIRKYRTIDQLYNIWRKHFFKILKSNLYFKLLLKEANIEGKYNVLSQVKKLFPKSKSNYLGPIGNKITTLGMLHYYYIWECTIFKE